MKGKIWNIYLYSYCLQTFCFGKWYFTKGNNYVRHYYIIQTFNFCLTFLPWLTNHIFILMILNWNNIQYYEFHKWLHQLCVNWVFRNKSPKSLNLAFVEATLLGLKIHIQKIVAAKCHALFLHPAENIHIEIYHHVIDQLKIE